MFYISISEWLSTFMTLTMSNFGEKLPEDEIFYSDDSDSEISWVSKVYFDFLPVPVLFLLVVFFVFSKFALIFGKDFLKLFVKIIRNILFFIFYQLDTGTYPTGTQGCPGSGFTL